MDNTKEARMEQRDAFLDGNERINDAINAYYSEPSEANFSGTLYSIYVRMMEDGHFIIPADVYEEEGQQCFAFKTLLLENEELAVAAFTTAEDFECGPESGALSHFIDSFLTAVKDDENFSGVLLNPWRESFFLTKEMIGMILSAKEE